jgi:DNA-binding NarL/FixJ family response regulator
MSPVEGDAPRPSLVLLDGARGVNGTVRSGTVRVAVAVGSSPVRGTIRGFLEGAPGMAVVGEAATSRDLVALARWSRPHVLLMDVRLPGLEHVRATRDVLAEGVAVMLLAPSAADHLVLPALRAGAGGVVACDADPARIVNAVRALARGTTVLTADVARQLTTEDVDRGRGVVVPLRRRPKAHHQHKEDRMLTPKVIELRRGCVRGNVVGPIKLLAPPVRG